MQEGKDLSLKLEADVASGEYSNLAVITHSRNEFVLDFAQVLPGLPQPKVISRVIMPPEHAKRLLFALSDNIKKYENSYGPIDINDGQIPITGNGTRS